MQRIGRIASSCRSALALLAAWCIASPASAGGPFGIDHPLAYDNRGIWARSNQDALIDVLLIGVAGGALWEGGEERFGRTLWQSIDATVIGGASSQVLKVAFSRARPDQGPDPDPNQWFKGHGFQSFPSGEVTTVSAVVTPLVLEYGPDHPAVYALELLPVYDGIARMKVRAHWQSDVLAGFALGSAAGWYAHRRASPLVLAVVPHALYVGLSKRW